MVTRAMGLCLVIFWLHTRFSASGTHGDPYSISVVKAALRDQSVGVRHSWVEKRVHRLGDAVSIALLKIFDRGQLLEPAVVKSFLPVIRGAFAHPELIAIADDKKPNVTVFVLSHIRHEIADAAMQNEVLETIRFVEK